MLLRMVFMLALDGGGTFSMLKCRKKRGVTSCRPPPGGAHAQISVVSSTSFQKSFLRS